MKRSPGKRAPGRVNSKCKGPEVGSSLMCLRKRKKVIVAGSSITFSKILQGIWNILRM